MKKYFKITEACEFKKDYLEYLDSKRGMNTLVNSFFKENEIETDYYYADKNRLYIQPTNKDLEKFDRYLNKPLSNGLRAFKKNSKMLKKYNEALEQSNVEYKDLPMLWTYLSYTGNVTTSVLCYNNEVYAEIEAPNDFEQNGEGFIEISASEYFKAKESLAS